MNRFTTTLAAFALILSGTLPAYAQDGHEKHGNEHHGPGSTALQKVEAPEECANCGMDRTVFAQSRAMVEYQNGDKTGVCSINCAVIDLDKNPKLKLKRLRVADYNSKKLIDASTATWVMGGSKRGVMTRYAKWAFADKARAEEFIREFGGKLISYEEILVAVRLETAARGH